MKNLIIIILINIYTYSFSQVKESKMIFIKNKKIEYKLNHCPHKGPNSFIKVKVKVDKSLKNIKKNRVKLLLYDSNMVIIKKDFLGIGQRVLDNERKKIKFPDYIWYYNSRFFRTIIVRKVIVSVKETNVSSEFKGYSLKRGRYYVQAKVSGYKSNIIPLIIK